MIFIGRKVNVNAMEKRPIKASSKYMAKRVNGRFIEKLLIKSLGIEYRGKFLWVFIICFIIPLSALGSGIFRRRIQKFMFPAIRPNVVPNGSPTLNSDNSPNPIFSPVAEMLLTTSDSAMCLNSLYLLNSKRYMRYCPLKNTSNGMNSISISNFVASLNANIIPVAIAINIDTVVHNILHSFTIADISAVLFAVIIACSYLAVDNITKMSI